MVDAPTCGGRRAAIPSDVVSISSVDISGLLHDSEKRRFQDDVVGGDCVDTEEFRYLRAERRSEKIVGRPVSQRLTDVAVDVGHYQVHVGLGEGIERRGLQIRRPLWQDVS